MSDTALIEQFRHIATASLAGVMLKMGLSNQWVRGPMPLKADFPRVAGSAFTMRFIPARENVPGAFANRLPVNRDAVEVMEAGAIAVAAARGTMDAATLAISLWPGWSNAELRALSRTAPCGTAMG